MKKIGMFLALVGVVMFAFAGSVMAVDLDSKGMGVTATVADYAEVILSATDTLYDLDGSAEDTDTVSISASIETNCNASVTISATPLEIGTDKIDTTYDVTIGSTTASFDPDTPTTFIDETTITQKGTYAYTVAGTATLGAIAAQEAGLSYAATVTVTVASL